MTLGSPTAVSANFGKNKPLVQAAPRVGDLLKKSPPHAVENEAALIGAMILDWRICGEVLQIVRSPEDFYLQRHVTLYRVLLEMYDQVQTIELPQLKQRLADLGVLDEVGGVAYLLELAESVPSAAGAVHYARIVRDKAILRHLIDAAGQILDRAYASADPVSDQLDTAEQEIFRLAESGLAEEAPKLNELLQDIYTHLESHDGRDVTGLATGYYELDEMTSGFQNGEMIIIAARPSMGKTALALNIAEHFAATCKQPVGIFSMEMGKHQLAQRLLCSRSGVDSQKLRRNMLNEDDFFKLQHAVGDLAEAPLYIDDSPGLTSLTLRARSRRLAARHGIKAVVVDYLQLMSNPGSESRQQEVSNISRGIKALARELNVPVICLSQLNRQSEGREGHKPRLSDLRESGSIEQDADVVALLHREDYYHKGEEDHIDTNIAELIVAKQRNGPTGTVKLQFDSRTTRFNNLTTHYPVGGV